MKSDGVEVNLLDENKKVPFKQQKKEARSLVDIIGDTFCCRGT